MSAALRGLTWDHPRGYGPLLALDSLDATPGRNYYGNVDERIVWDVQPLEGFESASILKTAVDYDIIVMDHPHIADAVLDGALIPLEDLVDARELAAWRAAAAGPSFDSYRFGDRSWAVPIDAATQVLAAQPSAPALDTWVDVAAFAHGGGRVALCVAGPHAMNLLLALLAAQNVPVAESSVFADVDAVAGALTFLRSLHEQCVPGLDDANPIRMLELMQQDRSIAVTPLIYGYVNYAQEDRDDAITSPLQFRNAPAWNVGGRRGSVLGGTGLAVSIRCDHPEVAAQHARRLMSEHVQRILVPGSGGQPSSRAAWQDEQVNLDSGDFYRGTLATLEDAWVRPRLSGWPHFQDVASTTIRAVFHGDLESADGAARILEQFATIVTV